MCRFRNPRKCLPAAALEKAGPQKSHICFLRLVNLGDSHTTNFDNLILIRMDQIVVDLKMSDTKGRTDD
jgi:hypothetical protein